MSNELRIGMIGLDTSHVVAFTRLLNDPLVNHYVPGGKVIVAFPGGSADMEMSYSRVKGYTDELCQKYGVKMVDSPEAVAEQCDAILLESVDGRIHLEQFRKLATYAKPTFIDKPLATTSKDAQEIFRLASENHTPIMSCSSLRYAESLTTVLNENKQNVVSADCYGPMEMIPTQPGLFWYGIHTVEMLYRALGSGCLQVTGMTSDDHDLLVGKWKDGRIGTIRGNRTGNNAFGALIHAEDGTQFVDVHAAEKPYYASLLEHLMTFFNTGKADVAPQETLEIIRFIEAANESRQTGQTVIL